MSMSAPLWRSSWSLDSKIAGSGRFAASSRDISTTSAVDSLPILVEMESVSSLSADEST